MKKALVIFAVLLCATCLFASGTTKWSINAALGISPSVGVSASVKNFEFQAEARYIGGYGSVSYDVLPSEKHDLNLGIGGGATTNIVLILASIASGQPYCYSADLYAKYSFNFGKHSSIFVAAGFPVVYWLISDEPSFAFSGLENLKNAGVVALTAHTKIGYRYTF